MQCALPVTLATMLAGLMLFAAVGFSAAGQHSPPPMASVAPLSVSIAVDLPVATISSQLDIHSDL